MRTLSKLKHKDGSVLMAKHYHQYSGRLYFYAADDRWVTPYDDNYGAGYYQNNESGGTGADPIIEWEHIGHEVTKGDILEDVRLKMRNLDQASVEDNEIYIVFTEPDTPDRLDLTGLDADGEDNHVLLWRGNWYEGGTNAPAFTGARNDKYRRTIPIKYTFPSDGDLRIYFKPISVDPRPNTANDYMQQSHSWGILTNIFEVT